MSPSPPPVVRPVAGARDTVTTVDDARATVGGELQHGETFYLLLLFTVGFDPVHLVLGLPWELPTKPLRCQINTCTFCPLFTFPGTFSCKWYRHRDVLRTHPYTLPLQFHKRWPYLVPRPRQTLRETSKMWVPLVFQRFYKHKREHCHYRLWVGIRLPCHLRMGHPVLRTLVFRAPSFRDRD